VIDGSHFKRIDQLSDVELEFSFCLSHFALPSIIITVNHH
jgi:hypothetical protein